MALAIRGNTLVSIVRNQCGVLVVLDSSVVQCLLHFPVLDNSPI